MRIKRNGFADSYIARKWGMNEREVYELRKANGIIPGIQDGRHLRG